MPRKRSAGLLPYRRRGAEVFLVHPGGPFWAKRDAGAWSIPKGEVLDGEDPLEAAQREFVEETGFAIGGHFVELRPVRQPGGKVIHAWLVEFDCDPEALRSQQFTMEWPPRSGRSQQFPEVDRAAWFPLSEARHRLLPGQVDFLDQLAEQLGVPQTTSATDLARLVRDNGVKSVKDNLKIG